MGWGALAPDVPLDGAQPPAQPQQATPGPLTPKSVPEAPAGFAPLPVDAQLDEPPSPTSTGGFSDEQKQAILDYLPKAKDAADLERFSSELTQGHSKIGNAADVIAKRDQGHKQFSWETPTADKSMATPAVPPSVRDQVGEHILGAIDNISPVAGAFLRNARDDGSMKAYLEHVSNAAAADYGPEAAGFLDTVGSPSQYGDFSANLDRNVAHQRAQITGDSEGHPIASIAGELTGAALTAPVGGEAADAAGLSSVPSAIKAAAGGAAYGSGAAGPGNRVAGAVEGAALGAGTDLAAPYVIKAIPGAGKAIAGVFSRTSSTTPEAVAAAQAAQDLGIALPKFALSDADRARSGALEQTAAGRGAIRAGRTAMLDTSEAARNAIANGVGTAPETAAQLGDQTLDAAVKSNKARRSAIGTLYDYASTASAGAAVKPAQTVSTIDSLLSDESSKIGGSKIAPVLQNIKDGLAQAGTITVDQARDLRTTLREQLTNEAGSTPSNADRITNQVMAAVNADMRNSLPGDAFNIYKQADTAWAQQRGLEDDVLKPFLGKDFDNWGDQVAAKINSDAKGNGMRLARFLGSLPGDAANNVRASLISGLGKSRDGAQNAEGNAFSLNTFLTNWNQLGGARKLIFGQDTVRALDKLADVANVGKLSETARNHSNSGGVFSRLLMGAGEFGGGAAILTGHVKEGILGLLASGLMAAKQYGTAKLLANPDFAKRLASTPMNAKAAASFWSRPWANAMAAKNPAIAGEIQLFQNAVNDNLRQMPAAASNPNGPGQNEKANGTQP